MSECYPYTTIVGVEELKYDDKRPAYKRAKKGVQISMHGRFAPRPATS